MDTIQNQQQFDIPKLHCRKLFNEPITNDKKTFFCDFGELEERHELNKSIFDKTQFVDEGDYIQKVLKNNYDYLLGMIINYHNDFIMKNMGDEIIKIEKTTKKYLNPKRSQTYRSLNMAIPNNKLVNEILIDINDIDDGPYEMGDINRSDFAIIFNGGCRIRLCLDNDDDKTMDDIFLEQNQFATLLFRGKKHDLKIFVNDDKFEKTKKDFHIIISDTFCFGKTHLDDVVNKKDENIENK